MSVPTPAQPPGPTAEWEIHRRAGAAGYLHDLDLLGPTTTAGKAAVSGASHPVARAVWLLHPTAPAVVLGSAQRFTTADVTDEVVARSAEGRVVPSSDAPARERGVHGGGTPPVERDGAEVVVRRSGGGAVVLEPGVSVWVDVVLPRRDPLWDDDVSTSARWLGQAWVTALSSLGIDAAVHDGPTDRHAMARAACFAGLGPGEVVSSGRKLVGISQRRTRAGARFQCVAYTASPPVAALVGLVGEGSDPEALAGVLASRTGIVPVDPEVLTEAVCRAIIAAGQPQPTTASPWGMVGADHHRNQL